MSPKRIVCLAAEIPEILHRLGALDTVVGISAYTTRPVEALVKPKVSGFQHGSVKRIMQVGPELAVLTSGVQRDLANELAAEGVTLLHLNPHRLDDLFRNIDLLGNIVGESGRAKQLNDELRMEIEEIRSNAALLPWHPRVYFEEWMDPLICGTGWVSDLLEIAGGIDVFREASVLGRKASDRVIDPLDVVKAAPDMVFASWCGKPFDLGMFTDRPDFQSIPAVRNGAVYELDGIILQCGPMLIDALKHVHRLICDFVTVSGPNHV